jgi:hypothetical protein
LKILKTALTGYIEMWSSRHCRHCHCRRYYRHRRSRSWRRKEIVMMGRTNVGRGREKDEWEGLPFVRSLNISSTSS